MSKARKHEKEGIANHNHSIHLIDIQKIFLFSSNQHRQKWEEVSHQSCVAQKDMLVGVFSQKQSILLLIEQTNVSLVI